MFSTEPTASKPSKEVTLHSRVTVLNKTTKKEEKYLIATKKTGQLTLGYEHIPLVSPFVLKMINHKAGFEFEHESKQYKIMDVQ